MDALEETSAEGIYGEIPSSDNMKTPGPSSLWAAPREGKNTHFKLQESNRAKSFGAAQAGRDGRVSKIGDAAGLAVDSALMFGLAKQSAENFYQIDVYKNYSSGESKFVVSKFDVSFKRDVENVLHIYQSPVYTNNPIYRRIVSPFIRR